MVQPVHITIEPISLEHVSRVQELASDPALAASTHLPSPYPEDGARSWFRRVTQEREAGCTFPFAIRNEGEEFVGVVSINKVNREQQMGCLGYWIGRPYWGRGYATEAVRHALRFAFEDLGLSRIHADALKDNTSSRRVLEKLGFGFLGDGQSDEKGAIVSYDLERQAWAQSR